MSVAEKPDVRPAAVQARCVRLSAKAADAASISPVIETQTLSRGENDLLIELKAAAVNPSDVKGARAIGVVRKAEPYEGHSNSQVEVIDASVTDVAVRVRELTDGRGADIVFNTVGDPYFEAAHRSLALRGRQILIAAVDRIVQFNILEFYRGQHTYVGIDTLGLSSVAAGAVLRELAPGFASGHLEPFTNRHVRVDPVDIDYAVF